MAYQNVGRPRFYVDIYSYFHSLGITANITGPFNFFGLNPSNQKTRDYDLAAGDSAGNWFNFGLNRDIKMPIEAIQNVDGYSVVGLLGHNFASNGIAAAVKTQYHDGTTQTDGGYGGSLGVIVNYNNDTSSPDYDGFSLYKTKLNGVSVDNEEVFNELELRLAIFGAENLPSTGTHKLGCVFFGTYYDMPHSPDLNLKLSYEYDGVKTFQSKSGATLSNASYTKPADWGDIGAWQLGGTSNLRSGRRVWDLSFSYLSDTDVFPVNASTGYVANSVAGYYTDTNNPTTGFSDIGADGVSFSTNILDGQDFFSQVWNRTMGGHLPFIFQPDGGGGVDGAGNFNPDQYAICRFDMDSLQYDQVANNVYNVKLKIREVW